MQPNENVKQNVIIILIKREPFDYTTWQRQLWPGKSVDDIFEAAKEFQKQNFKAQDLSTS